MKEKEHRGIVHIEFNTEERIGEEVIGVAGKTGGNGEKGLFLEDLKVLSSIAWVDGSQSLHDHFRVFTIYIFTLKDRKGTSKQ